MIKHKNTYSINNLYLYNKYDEKNVIVVCFMALGVFSLMAQKARTAEEKQYLDVLKNRSEKILDQYVELRKVRPGKKCLT